MILRIVSLALLGWLALARTEAAQLEVLRVGGSCLKGNPLGDPDTRDVAVFSPAASTRQSQLPMVIYLPGWGSSSQDAISQGNGSFLARVVDRLVAADLPLRIAVADARSRYHGSQYLNSSATGQYADYITQEVFERLASLYPNGSDGAAACVLAGHSSGGYGALMLGMAEHGKFQGVVALSPDSDFEVTHKPLVEQPAVKALTPADLEAATASAKEARLPEDGIARLVVGLSANYTPIPAQPGKFEWLYTAAGEWRPEVWARWIALDPLTAVRARPGAFSKARRVYLDGAEHDEFGANIGARKIYEALKEGPTPVAFDEPPGGHGDHLAERLARGLLWVMKPNAGDATRR